MRMIAAADAFCAVNENRVDLIDDDEGMAALDHFLGHLRHVVTQVVEAELVIRTIGNDDIGIVSNISNIISKDEKIVMRSINIESNDGLFSGNLVVLLDDNSKLNMLIKKLRTVKGVKEVMRI